MARQSFELNCINISPESYTWVVRKQFNWAGKSEYMIEVVELEGCVSYGDTFAEAKNGLKESIELWFQHNGVKSPPLSIENKLILMEPKMTKEEFHSINKQLLQLLN